MYYICNCRFPIPRKRHRVDWDGYQKPYRCYFYVCKNCEYPIDWDMIEFLGLE